jgi:hypothetical protein
VFVFGEASAERLQKYEDSRWCLFCAGALVEKLQKYAVWGWWLLCDEALVERLRNSSRARLEHQKQGLLLRRVKEGRSARGPRLC